MSYKLLAVDIDGTLLNSSGLITSRTKEAIYEAVGKGVIFVISTGRPIQGVQEINEELGLDLPYITYNGSMIVMGKSKDILYERSLSKEQAEKIYHIGIDHGLTIIVWSKNKLYSNKSNERSKEYSKVTNTHCIRITNLSEIKDPITKILWYEDHTILSNIYENTKDQFDDGVNIHFSRPYYLEFVDKLATKAIAINKLCDYFGFNYKDTIAIGDGENDLSMIRSAGLGVAMANASEKIRNEAGFVTSSCDEDGVANVIDRFILI